MFPVMLLKRKGKLVGTDKHGNSYYSLNGRRSVEYSGIAEPTKVSPEWHLWLHYTTDNTPKNMAEKDSRFSFERKPNLTGTIHSYLPKWTFSEFSGCLRFFIQPLYSLESHRRKVMVGGRVFDSIVGLCAIAVCYILILQILDSNFSIKLFSKSDDHYSLYASFGDADGIKKGSDVRIAGVTVGSVLGCYT